MIRKICTLEKQIAKIKKEINALDDLRRGSLSKQYNICGTAGCKCKAAVPKKHGPYYQLSFTKNGKSSTKFVNSRNAKTVSRQVKNYACLRNLVNKWVELGTELSELRLLNQEG